MQEVNLIYLFTLKFEPIIVYLRFQELTEAVPWNLWITHRNIIEYDKLLSEPWYWTYMASKRRFQKVKISEAAYWNKRLLCNLFARIGGCVQELHLIVCILDYSPSFLDFLRTMPKLKKIVLHEVGALETFMMNSNYELPMLSKLETLVMVKSEYVALKCFAKSKISTFKLFTDTIEDDIQPLLDFLKAQKNLTTLALRSMRNSQLFEAAVADDAFTFKLQKLSLVNFKFTSIPNDYNELLKFLQTQSRFIVELELGIFPESIIEFVFSTFRSLRLLRISVKSIPSDMNFYKRLEVNSSVDKLVLCGSSKMIIEPLKEFFHHLPNLETLVLAGTFDATICAASKYVHRLQHLHILEPIDAFNFDAIKCPHLKTLFVGEIVNTFDYGFLFGSEIDWKTFGANNPNIIELHLKTINLDYFYIGDIVKNLRLKVLRVGSKIIADKKFFKVVRESSKDLQLLSINQCSNKIKMSKLADIASLHFHGGEALEFPEPNHGAFWCDKVYY